MDDAADERFWFDTTALTAPREASIADRLGLRRTALRDTLAQFAAANRMDFDGAVRTDLPAFGFASVDDISEVLATIGDPFVIFGNHGLRFLPDSHAEQPDRMGFVAVQHGLVLPEVLAVHVGPRARTLRDGARRLVDAYDTVAFWNWLDPQSSFPSRSSISSFVADGVELTTYDETGTRIHARRGEEEQAWRLITPEVVSRLAELTTSFTVHVDEGWIMAHSHYGDVSTDDAEVWAWVFSAASRLIDLAAAWRTEPQPWRAVDDEAIAPWDLREVPFYTDRWVTRPSSLDGVLSEGARERIKERAAQELREAGGAVLGRLRRGRGDDGRGTR